MERVDRRQVFGIWASSVMSVATACGGPGTTVLQTPEGPVLQLEKDEFLVLVSGIQPIYHPGERITVQVLINNQSQRFATARIRTRLLGRGQQAILEAEVLGVNVRPMDATSVERSLALPTNVGPGEYTLSIELPPWSFEGRQAGGGSLNTTLRIER